MTLMPSETEALTVGIDIGGTKTHLRAQRQTQIRDRILPSHEWRVRDWDVNAVRLLELTAELVDRSPVAAIAIGAHGCDDADECLAFERAFAARTSVPVRVVNDAELMPLALDLTGQIGIVAGTGSIAVCRTAAGEMLVAGGWGWIIGDEGSAASLVREAVRVIADHFDAGGSRHEPLIDLIFDALQVPAVPRLGSSLSALQTAAEIGRHAEVVFEAANRGSDLALRVIRDGGKTLAHLVDLLDRRGAGAQHAVAGGSVIVSQPLLWQAFAEGLAQTSGGRITPHLFTGKPVEGACRLAASLAQTEGQRGIAAPLHL
ncbi:MAG: sugar kinase [Ancalomicrobiaceae bacterium]|nr:sugar kinase [Ancalomicrobiaceae bacterium]